MAPTVEERNLRVLIAKKEAHFKFLQSVFDLTKKIDDDKSRAKFLNLVGAVNRRRTELSAVVDEELLLRLELDDKFEPNYDIMDTVEEMCGHIFNVEKSLKNENLDSNESRKHQSKGNHVQDRKSPRLPKIELPCFSGDIREWEAFYDLFNNLVHENKDLTNMDKLYYLVGCLKGQAKNICTGLAMSGDNYEVVWDALIQRYHDTRALANAYLGQILEWRDFREESEKGLNLFLEKFDAPVRALRNLNLRDLADFMLLYHALSKLNPETVNYFEINRNSDSVPQYEELLDFIRVRVKTLAATKSKNFVKVKESDFSKIKKSFVVNKSDVSDGATKCGVCGGVSHNLSKCQDFNRLNPKDRYVKVKDLNLCYNCFSADHGVRDCPSTGNCNLCNYKHHKLIHHDRTRTSSNKMTAVEKSEAVSLCSTGVHKIEKPTIVLLGTARVEVEGCLGRGEGRFLLDNGSQANLVSTRFCKNLGLSISKKLSAIQGVGGISQPVQGITTFTIFSNVKNSGKPFSCSVTALVVQKITGHLPQVQVDLQDNSWLLNLPLADADFGRPGPIDGIFGAEIFSSILSGGHLRKKIGGPVAVGTSLGYVVAGRVPAKREVMGQQTFISTSEDLSLEDMVKQFWKMEAVPEVSGNLLEDDGCEENFCRNFSRDEEGRFTVALPFKLDPSSLGDSKSMAKRRYFALESRLNKNVELKTAYHKAMRDFTDQGHIYPVSEKSSVSPSYYIPHHAVLKANSESTPVRIVLDASAPSDNGLSLNSVLCIGPKLQTDIGSILTRFRLFSVALTSDIKQMYRQINIVPRHRKFQRLYWRWSPDEPLRTWELKTVAFGVKSSPYLALRCVKELLRQEGPEFSKTAEIIENNLYMDDLVVSVPSVSDAKSLFSEAVELFKRGKFELTKWASNSEEFLEKIPNEMKSKHLSPVNFKSKTSVLGLTWDPCEDRILINFPNPSPVCTKRGILSSVARCFDPIGLSAPLTLYLKILVKDLWNSKLNWDEEAPPSVQRRWKRVIAEWPVLKNFALKRSFNAVKGGRVQLFGFADASKNGYGGVVYLLNEEEQSILQFVGAKSRVSPMKTVSIPRLELCAALLLTNLMAYVLETLKTEVNVLNLFAFSDSSTVLQWLNSGELKDCFVKNRVARIKELLPDIKWNHIAGKDNPADGLSRGMTPAQLVKNDLWIQGPSWAQLPETEWPCLNFEIEGENVRSFITTKVKPDEEIHPLLKLIERISSWTKILKITVWVLRCLKIIPKGPEMRVEDLEKAEMTLISLVQKKHFGDDLRALQEGREPSNRLRNLRPFIQQGVLRVGGRLSNADIQFEQRHPIILPKTDSLSERIVQYYHIKNFHTGAYLVEALLREKFWILRGRTLIKKIIRSCNQCFKTNPKTLEPLMADLPEFRVKPSKAFERTGVDYFGPINITLGRKRGSKVCKAYVALFVCMTVKAIHLELVSSLSTEHFLQAFKRFLSRRGFCKVMYSDRGTNFIGAHRVLSELYTLIKSDDYNREIGNALLEQKVDWKFNPASAPHMGGLWESQVKVVKRHLLRVIGEQLLSYEELNTLLVEVEGLLNSRPLCQLNSDPLAPSALTPAHFLQLKPLESFPAEDVTNIKQNRLNRFQMLDQMVQNFWKRWHLEYLTTLQTRQKWSKNSENIKIGTVVLLKTENVPPLRWPLGIITEVFPGRDGVVRSVKLRCGQKELIRPVVKVCPLPTQ